MQASLTSPTEHIHTRTCRRTCTHFHTHTPAHTQAHTHAHTDTTSCNCSVPLSNITRLGERQKLSNKRSPRPHQSTSSARDSCSYLGLRLHLPLREKKGGKRESERERERVRVREREIHVKRCREDPLYSIVSYKTNSKENRSSQLSTAPTTCLAAPSSAAGSSW